MSALRPSRLLRPLADALADAVALGPSGVAVAATVLAERGLLAPARPDRALRAAAALARLGVGPAAGVAAQARLRPGRPALVDDDGVLTWEELEARTEALAGGLAAAGVGPGSRVALLARNGRGWVEPVVALSRLGAAVVHLSTGSGEEQVRRVLARERVDAAVADADAEAVPVLRAAGLRPVVLATGAPGDVPDDPDAPLTLATLRRAGGTAPPPPTQPSPQVVLTSGTTGVPRGAERSDVGLVDALALLDRVPLPAGGTTVVAAPLFHSWGMGVWGVSLLLGSTVVATRRAAPRRVWDLVAVHRADALALVPVVLAGLLDVPEGERPPTPALRVVASSGSALPVALERRARAALGPVVHDVYGSTEVSVAAVATPQDLAEAPGTVGRPPLGTRVAVLDPRGVPLPPGVVGRVFVGNRATFAGYTSGEDRERVGPLVGTGDLGHTDAVGRLFVAGREDDMVVVGGENVFPGPVEDLLATLPGVREAAVVGEPDERWGARLVAFVVPVDERTPPDTDGLLLALRTALSAAQVPRELHLVAALPRTATGKVVRRRLLRPGATLGT